MLFECKKSRQIHVFYVEWQCNRNKNLEEKMMGSHITKVQKNAGNIFGELSVDWMEAWRHVVQCISSFAKIPEDYLISFGYTRCHKLRHLLQDAIEITILQNRYAVIVSKQGEKTTDQGLHFVIIEFRLRLDDMNFVQFCSCRRFNHFIANWLKYARGYHAGIITVDWFFDAFEICVCENSQRLTKASYGDMTWSMAKNIWSWMVVLGT